MRTAHELPDEITTTVLPTVKVLLDGYLRDPGDPEKFCVSMLSRCRSNPDTIWELLALIDQYERRGQTGSRDFRALKVALGREACGRPVSGKMDARKPVQRIPEVRPKTESTELTFARASAGSDATELTPGKTAGEELPTRLAIFPQSAVHGAGLQSATGTAKPTFIKNRLPQKGMVLRDRFVLEEVLGSGGMGKVYRAFDRNRLDLPEADRYVALKVLRDDLSMRPEALDRLKREFHQTQRLSHPGIVNVFDLDSEVGIHFITMELLRGELLGDVMSRIHPQRVDRRTAFTLLRDLGSALSYAHESGIVHADLKPGNVMITLQGELRVLDFGLAMPLMREPWISTAGDAFQGVTRTYASCERIAGDSPDVRDDIFSYACIAYELLAGKHPFSRRPASEARAEGMPLRRIPDLSRQQWQALKKGLEWQRVDRPDTLAELVADLVPESFPRHLPPPHEMESQRPPHGTSRKWLWGGAITLAAAVVFIAGLANRDSISFTNLKAGALRSGALAATFASAAAKEANEWRERFSQGPANAGTGDSGDLLPKSHANPLPAIEIVPDAGPTVSEAPATFEVPEIPGEAPRSAASSANELRSPARLSFSQQTLQVSESSSVARLIVHRTGPVNQSSSFSWRTVARSATEDMDYASFGTVVESFAPGQSDVAVLVPIVRDSIREGIETFDVEILESSGQARLGSVTRATVVIDDGDESN